MKAVSISCALFAIVEGAMSVLGFTMGQWFPDYPWWILVVLMLTLFAVTVLLIRTVLVCMSRNGISVDVGGNDVRIVRGDIFSYAGKKVIPFNECFDTQVDDHVISKASLNGRFILEHVDDFDSPKVSLGVVEHTTLDGPVELGGRLRYPLGTVKLYGDYALLAFSRFNELNEAHLSMPEFESCLMAMWRELSRVYAGEPIVLPLLGSGITRFDDVPRKEPDDLLRCMLCTLKVTGAEFCAPVTIVLTDDMADQMHLYEAKGAV